VRAAVSSCGFTLFTCNRRGGHGEMSDVSDWSHAGYMPRIAELYACRGENMPFEWTQVLAAIAPRAVFINAPEEDDFLVDGVRQCVQSVQPEYARREAPDALVSVHPPGGHDFPTPIREQAYRFLEKALGAGPVV